jgi:hypothetical protein
MILSSSTVFSNQLLSSSEAQTWFDRIFSQKGITGSSEQSVEALRAVDVEVLIEKTNFARIAFRPMLDGITIPYDPRQVIFDSTLWDDYLEELIIGHCENEVSIVSFLGVSCVLSGVQSFLRSATYGGAIPILESTVNGRVPPTGNLRARAMEIYGESKASDFAWFGGEDVKISPAALSWMALDSHARYYAVTQLLSTSFVTSSHLSNHPRKLYKYIFSWIPQFWPKGWPATHTADILPMFLHRALPESHMEVAYSFVDSLVYFATNEEAKMSWKQYKADECDRKFNRIQRNGRWSVINQDSGEFGLRKDIVDFWRDSTQASLAVGMEGWEGMIR